MFIRIRPLSNAERKTNAREAVTIKQDGEEGPQDDGGNSSTLDGYSSSSAAAAPRKKCTVICHLLAGQEAQNPQSATLSNSYLPPPTTLYKVFHPTAAHATSSNTKGTVSESQVQFFKLCDCPKMIERALAGYRATLFAYGQTGAGKVSSVLPSRTRLLHLPTAMLTLTHPSTQPFPLVPLPPRPSLSWAVTVAAATPAFCPACSATSSNR